MNKLRAVKPEKKEKRLKMFVYGDAGVGKTAGTLQFPNAYIIDTEGGTEEYSDSINKNNSIVFHTTKFDEVKEEIKTLLTTKHNYRTLILDCSTILVQDVREKWTNIFAKYESKEKNRDLQDYGGRYWQRVGADWKGLFRLMIQLDMNVIVTAHQKDEYAGGASMQKIGVTYDGTKDDRYFFSYTLRIENRSGKLKGPRTAVLIKERGEIGDNKFPDEFEWNYDNFKKYYGADIIERESTPIKVATMEQLKKVRAMIELFDISEDNQLAWLRRLNVETFEEAPSESVAKWLEFHEKKYQDEIKNQDSKIQTLKEKEKK